jgi:MerR family transcriptional regulator, light-induced transcriptional regulator
MSPEKNDHIYNLKVVIQETGIKPDTLRAWERRYGLPQPERTTGGHRLYSDYDIELIKWLIARQNDGMRINRAVELWKSLELEGSIPLETISHTADIRYAHSPMVISGINLEEMRGKWIGACLTFDEQAAEYILAQSFARFPLESVCLEVLQEGLSEIGLLWYAGKATVQQEHFASALAIRRLNSLIAASPTPYRSETILVACPPHEVHVIGPMLVTLFLRHQGWNVVYLGADVPVTNLERALDSTKAKLIILNATMLYTAASLFEVGKFLRSRNKVFAFGGYVYNRIPTLRHRIPGYFLGEKLDNVANQVEKILEMKSSPPISEPISGDYQSAIEEILDHQFQIEARVWETIKGNDVSLDDLQTVNYYLGKNIIAALKLGNIEFLKPEIDWIAGLIKNHGLAPSTLSEYMRSYAAAVTKYMPEFGQIVVEFLISESEQLVGFK